MLPAALARLDLGKNTFLPTFSRTQFPLMDACTLTDRQAQGMTLDAVIADVRRAPGAKRDDYWIGVYVALSRARSLDTIQSTPGHDFRVAVGRLTTRVCGIAVWLCSGGACSSPRRADGG